MAKTRVYTDESGRTSFLDPKTNEYVWIPGDQAQAAVNAGLTPETPEMFHRRSASHDTGLSAALGLLRGGTIGGSDILLRQVAPNLADYAKTLREENAATSLGPEALGLTATSLLTGGIGAAAPATAAARGLGSTILRGAGRGLIEGGIAGAGLAAGQAQLEDRGLGGTITEAARGGAAGAATGGILGGAAAPIGRSLARGAARQAAKKAQAAAESKVATAAANTELDELAKIMGMEPDQAIRRLYSDIAQKRMVGEGLKGDWIVLKELIGNAGADDAYRTLQSSIRGVDDVPKQGSAAFNTLRKELDEALFDAAQRIEGGKYLEFFDAAGRWSGRARPGQSAPHSLDLQVASTFDDVGKLYGQLKKQVKKISGVDIQVPGRDQLMGAGVMGGLVNQGVYQVTRSGAMAKLAGLAMQGGRRLAQNTAVRGITRGLGRMSQMAAVDMAAQLASDVTARQDYEAAYTGMPGAGQANRKGADLTRQAIDTVVQRKQLEELAADIPPDATETHASIQAQIADLTAKIESSKEPMRSSTRRVGARRWHP